MIPFILLLLLGPTLLPTFRPSGGPTLKPTPTPTKIPTAKPSTSQPTSKPTTIFPRTLSYQTLSFSAVSTLHGVNCTGSSSAASKLDFRHAVAMSMSEVRLIDVSIHSDLCVPVIVTHQRSLVEVITTIAWNVTLDLIRLNAPSASSAYVALTTQLNASMSSGSFVTLLHSMPSALAGTTAASVQVSAYTIATAFSPTANPTLAPTIFSTLPSV